MNKDENIIYEEAMRIKERVIDALSSLRRGNNWDDFFTTTLIFYFEMQYNFLDKDLNENIFSWLENQSKEIDCTSEKDLAGLGIYFKILSMRREKQKNIKNLEDEIKKIWIDRQIHREYFITLDSLNIYAVVLGLTSIKTREKKVLEFVIKHIKDSMKNKWHADTFRQALLIASLIEIYDANFGEKDIITAGCNTLIEQRIPMLRRTEVIPLLWFYERYFPYLERIINDNHIIGILSTKREELRRRFFGITQHFEYKAPVDIETKVSSDRYYLGTIELLMLLEIVSTYLKRNLKFMNKEERENEIRKETLMDKRDKGILEMGIFFLITVLSIALISIAPMHLLSVRGALSLISMFILLSFLHGLRNLLIWRGYKCSWFKYIEKKKWETIFAIIAILITFGLLYLIGGT